MYINTYMYLKHVFNGLFCSLTAATTSWSWSLGLFRLWVWRESEEKKRKWRVSIWGEYATGIIHRQRLTCGMYQLKDVVLLRALLISIWSALPSDMPSPFQVISRFKRYTSPLLNEARRQRFARESIGIYAIYILIAINRIDVIVNLWLIAINRTFLSILNVPFLSGYYFFSFRCSYHHGKVDGLALFKCFVYWTQHCLILLCSIERWRSHLEQIISQTM